MAEGSDGNILGGVRCQRVGTGERDGERARDSHSINKMMATSSVFENICAPRMEVLRHHQRTCYKLAVEVGLKTH